MKPKKLRKFLPAVATLVLLYSQSTSLQAASATWNTAGGGNWIDGVNWTPAAAPGSVGTTDNQDTATWSTTANSRTITVDANRNIKNITINGNNGAFSLTGGSLIISDGGQILRTGSGNNNAVIQGATPITLAGDATFASSGSNDVANLVINAAVTSSQNSLITLTGSNTGTGNTMSGIISDGAGFKTALTKTGTGVWSLNAAHTYTGQTTVTQGTLRLGAANRISDSSNLLVNGGIFNMNNFNETVGTVTISSGSINGSAVTLTGSSYALQGGTVNAMLGTGAITVSSGTTTLGSAGRLNSASVLAVNSGQLTLGGNETVASLTLGGGTLGAPSSTNTLTAASYALNGGTVNAKLGAGAITVSSGTTTLGSADRLATTSTLAVNGGQLTLGGAETVAGLTQTGGTLAGTGNTLTSASAYNMQAGTVSANLGGSVALNKTTSGTTTLSGTNSYSGLTTVSDGTLQVNGSTSASSAVVVNNAAILRGTGTVGGAVTLNGTSSLTSTGTLTLSNGFTAAGTTNSISGGTIAGSGSVNVGSTLNLASTATVSGSLAVNGNLTGTGTVTGALTGSGSVDVGNSPGVMTVSTINSQDLDFNFEFTATGVPNYGNSGASVNDVLRLTSATPFTLSLAASNAVNIYLNVASLTAGDTFLGGFFTDNNADFMSSIENATFAYYLANASGTKDYNGATYDLYTGPLTINASTVANTGNFGSGDVAGYVTQFSVIPEPSAALLGGLGMLVLLRRRRA